jgi:hypothetical protein
VEYASGTPDPTDTLKYNNNIFMGFYNAGAAENATPIYSNTDLNMLTNPGGSFTNNVTFSQRANWPCPHAGETAAICADPGLVDETYHAYGYGNMAPASALSAVVGKGVAIASLTTDYTGASLSTPPTIGAYGFASKVVVTPPPVVAPPPTPASCTSLGLTAYDVLGITLCGQPQ